MKKQKKIENRILNLDVINTASDMDDFEELWHMAEEYADQVRWIKGEIATRIETKYGDRGIEELAKRVGLARSTIDSYRRVARAFPHDVRRPTLSWSHYVMAAQADSYDKGNGTFLTSERFGWLDKAEEEGWQARRLWTEMKKEKGELKPPNEMLESMIQNFSESIKRFVSNNPKTAKQITTSLDALITEIKQIKVKHIIENENI